MIVSEPDAIFYALTIPLLGAVGIALTGRWPNIRETVTLTTAVAVAAIVWSLIPTLQAGGRPEF